jgi:hypothetical protein
MCSTGVPEAGKCLAHPALQGPDLRNHFGRTWRSIFQRDTVDPGQQSDHVFPLVGMQGFDDITEQ